MGTTIGMDDGILPGKKLQKEKYHEENGATTQVKNTRTNMALLHFIMTSPKWSISLFLYLAARQSPIPTPQEAVHKPIQRLQVAMEMESRSYRQCAQDSATMLQSELQFVAQNEQDRLDVVHVANQVVIEAARERKRVCSEAATKTRSILSQWQDTGNTVGWVNNTNVCLSAQKDYLTRYLGGETHLLEEEVTSVWERQIYDSLRGYQLIQDYAEARFQYDYEYFVTLRIQPTLDVIANFSNVYVPNLSIDYLVVEQRISEILSELQKTLLEVELHIEALKAKLDEMTLSLESFYLAYVDVYDRLVRGLVFVQDILPPGVPLPEFFDIQGLPLADSLLPSFAGLHLFQVETASMYQLLDKAVSLCLDILREAVMDLKAQSKHFLQGAIQGMSETLASLLELEDYDPPVFVGSNGLRTSLADEVTLQGIKSGAALEKTRLLLDRLINWNVSFATASDGNFTIGADPTTIGEESTSFSYLRPSFPALLFPKILAILLTIGSTSTWIIEIVIQAFRLWQLEHKYTNQAIPDLPKVSYHLDKDGDTGEKQEEESQIMLPIIARSVLAPRMVVAIIIAPLLLSIIAIWYPHVKRSCRDTRDGTVLANSFIAPILMNEANVVGNAYYLKAELQCYKKQREICEQMQLQARSRYHSDLTRFSSIEQKYNQSTEILQMFDACVAEATIIDIEGSCCGIKGFATCSNLFNPGFCPVDESMESPMPFRPMKTYLHIPACEREELMAMHPLEPKVDCGSLVQVCRNAPCDGVDKIMLRSETIETDCQVELYALRFFLFVLLVLYHAVTVSLMSTLLFNGIRNLFWRRVCQDSIPFSTFLQEDGSLAKGANRHDRAQRIAVTTSRFEKAGKLQLAIGIAVFLVWGALAMS